ncbi:MULTISPECIES: hypothetical protein [Streptomyces]|uniref:Uncharacterized protein n=1 Tax=Streptomyces dengpaensis TaxID=2049881 RepID=A0ABM6SY61_9ACTN|nr:MULTISPECIES: hypothetical protein [Streptomyces]AVH59724.1 hypothetical protein C4B68_32670 [Streptomyces dengpaensis]PIB09368.1 hypothetical protein B1C81_09350 [Streptomyces sp. HG99]
MTPRHQFGRRLDAVEQKHKARRLIQPYQLTDGSTVELSTLDVLGFVMASLGSEYADRHGHGPDDPDGVDGPEPVEPREAKAGIARTLAQLDPDHAPSMFGNLVRGLAAHAVAREDTTDG